MVTQGQRHCGLREAEFPGDVLLVDHGKGCCLSRVTGKKCQTLRPEDRKRQAAVGQAVEEAVARQPRQERLPQLNSNRTVVVTRATTPEFRAGERVAPVGGGGGAARTTDLWRRATALSRCPAWRPASGGRLR